MMTKKNEPLDRTVVLLLMVKCEELEGKIKVGGKGAVILTLY
jgi:hypothetical protein